MIEAIDQHGVTYDMTLAVGDRVRLFARTNCRRTDGKRGILGNNGSVLTVTAIHSGGISLRNGQGTEGFVTWKTLAAPDSGHIRLGYGDVLSIDATQGLTSTEHIEAIPRGSKAVDAHRAYTQGSRHRERTWLITSDGAERREIVGRRPLGDSRPIRQADILDNMARNMERRDRRSSALALLDRAREVRQQTLRDFQGAKLLVERRIAAGDPSTLMPAIARHRRNRVNGPFSLTTDILRDELSNTQAVTARIDLPFSVIQKHFVQTVAQVLLHFRTRLRQWRLRRALGAAQQRIKNGTGQLWKRAKRELTEDEIPEWGTDDYFGPLAKEEMRRYGSISMKRAAALHAADVWRLQDARRHAAAGPVAARCHVDRLFRLVGHDGAAPSDVLSITLPGRYSEKTDLFDAFLEDLSDMGISGGCKTDVLDLSRDQLSEALAAFDIETISAVCDRLLLARFARPTHAAEHIRNGVRQRSSRTVAREPSRRRSGPDPTD